MASLFSRLSIVPSFPDYTGPYKVGTVNVEIPVTELESPVSSPDGAQDLHTIQFRIFYPATANSEGRRITWLPAPQRLHVSAYTQFLGLGPAMANVLSFLPRHLHYTSIPASKNAAIQPPPAEPRAGRWPTIIFSHGLAGNRNAYSHLAGSLASHGLVVICPEHRDGSAILSLVRDPVAHPRPFSHNPRRVIPYNRIPLNHIPAVWAERDRMLRVRLWELGLIFDAILRLDSGHPMEASAPPDALSQFAARLDVREPGRVIFAGHSFGGATMIQLLKSTYYADLPQVKGMEKPLFALKPDANIRHQVTEKSPLILLDMWCFPLLSAASAALFDLPLPAYADKPTAAGGNALLAIESQAFFKWKEHLHATARVLSPDPAARVVSPQAWRRPETLVALSEPSFFYVENSAHLNQSDFGILFPWITKRAFGADQPERVLRLNLRAVLQFLRNNDVPVSRTWVGDLVDGGAHHEKRGRSSKDAGQATVQGDAAESARTSEEGKSSRSESSATTAGGLDDAETSRTRSIPRKRSTSRKRSTPSDVEDGISDDKAILEHSSKSLINAWKWIDIIGLGDESGPSELELAAKPEQEARGAAGEDGGQEGKSNEHTIAQHQGEQDMEEQMQEKMVPSLAPDV